MTPPNSETSKKEHSVHREGKHCGRVVTSHYTCLHWFDVALNQGSCKGISEGDRSGEQASRNVQKIEVFFCKSMQKNSPKINAKERKIGCTLGIQFLCLYNTADVSRISGVAVTIISGRARRTNGVPSPFSFSWGHRWRPYSSRNLHIQIRYCLLKSVGMVTLALADVKHYGSLHCSPLSRQT